MSLLSRFVGFSCCDCCLSFLAFGYALQFCCDLLVDEKTSEKKDRRFTSLEILADFSCLCLVLLLDSEYVQFLL